MAHPDRSSADDERDREGSPKGRRLGRVLIPLGILLVILGIFIYILVVSLGTTGDDEEIVENPGATAAVVLAAPLPG